MELGGVEHDARQFVDTIISFFTLIGYNFLQFSFE